MVGVILRWILWQRAVLKDGGNAMQCSVSHWWCMVLMCFVDDGDARWWCNAHGGGTVKLCNNTSGGGTVQGGGASPNDPRRADGCGGHLLIVRFD